MIQINYEEDTVHFIWGRYTIRTGKPEELEFMKQRRQVRHWNTSSHRKRGKHPP